MVIKYFILVLTIAFFIQIKGNESSRLPANEGVFPDIDKLDEDHSLNSNVSIADIEDFIVFASYDNHLCNDHYHQDFSKVDNAKSSALLSANQLAQEIFNTSKCFNIDAAILASLIYAESQFCNFGGKISQNKKPIITTTPRKSYTNAVGLTMFTTVAWTEVQQQLFSHDKSLFHFKTRPKIHNMMAQCQFASTHSFATAAEYYQYKTYQNDTIYNSNNFSIQELKKPTRWREQILYAAINIKIGLSKTKQPDDFNLEQNSIRHYYNMLRDYNGAGGEEEKKYWQLIFATTEEVFNAHLADMAKKENLSYDKSKWTAVKKSMLLNMANSNDTNSPLYQKLK